jgi:pSer/pThr/pTyr-binding forkhead associated (FHA) protein
MSLAKLVIAEAFKPARHILIDSNPFIIGRTNDCHLVLQHTSVSKEHAQITFDGQTYFIKDSESKNGTLLNGEPINEVTLKENDLINIGSFELLFQLVRTDQVNKEMERNLTKLKSVLEFTKSINANKVVDSILDEIMNALMSVTQADRGFLLLKNESGGLDLQRSQNISADEFRAEKFQISRTAIQKAVEMRSPVVLSNAQDDSSFVNQTSIRDLGIKTLACIPIPAISDEIIGLLYADSVKSEFEFTYVDVEILESLASNAGIAIENARVNNDIQKLIQKTSAVLSEVDTKAKLDDPLQASVRDALASIEDQTGTQKKVLQSQTPTNH